MKTADLQRSKRLKELGWEQNGYWWHVNSSWNYTENGCIEWLDDGKWNLCSSKPKTYHSIKSETKWNDWDKHFEFEQKRLPEIETVYAPTAGEMIEWLLQTHDIYFQDYQIELIGRDPWGLLHNKSFSTEQGICNALADACAWVKEMKK